MLFVNSFTNSTFMIKKAKHDFDRVPDVNNLEHEVETEATVKSPLPTSTEEDLPINIEPGHKLDSAHSDELATIAAEGSSKGILEVDATGGIELQSEVEQETPIPSAQETEVGVVSSSKDAIVAHKVETEVEAETLETDAATASNDLAASESAETEHSVVPTTEVYIFLFL